MTTPASTGEDRIVSTLPGVAEAAYGAAHRAHSLELYKLYVEMADRISARRERANSFFLTVNAALLAILVRDIEAAADVRRFVSGLLLPAAASTLCFLWYRIVRSYRDLNSAKFKVIHVMESQLPMRPYDAEWESVERGKNADLYLPFSHVEIAVPWVFIAFYAVVIVGTVPWRVFF